MWANLQSSLQRAQLRPMPALQAHVQLRRWGWWGSTIVVGAFAVLTTVSVFEDEWEWEHATLVFVGLAIACWALLYFVIEVVLRRPRHTPDSLAAAVLKRAAKSFPGVASGAQYDGPPGDTGVFIPGSNRISRTLAILAGAWALAFSFFAIAAEGGWRITWMVCAGVFAFSVVASAFAIRPRWLLLTPEWLYVAGSRASAQLRWDDIAYISYVPSYDGMMVYRITARHGVTTQPTRRHPFARARHNSLDIEFAVFNLDPLLLALAIEVYWSYPKARAEIEGPMPPARLTDPITALEGVQLPEHLSDYRPEFPKRMSRA